MIQASEELTAAIINEAPQRIIIELGDMLLSNEDLSASAGMEYVEESNADTDLSIGNAIANTISFTLLNVAGQYNNIVLAGKTLSAYLGAKSDSGLVTQATFFTGKGCIAVTEISSSTQLLFNIITASQARPYLKMNGKAVNDQPAYPIYALLLRDNILTAIGLNGYSVRYTVDGSNVTKVADYTPTTAEIEQYKRYALDGTAMSVTTGAQGGLTCRYFSIDGNKLYADTYECLPLGVFITDKPERQKERLIKITAIDRMKLFDKASDGFFAGLTYPITLGEMYSQLCSFAGVNAVTSTFLNSTKSFSEPPMTIKNGTCRELLSWIATVACSFARFNREGKLELAWYVAADKVFTPNQTFGLTPAEYTVKQIDKLQVSVTENDIGVIVPSDSTDAVNGYQIIDNPLLYGQSDADIRPYATEIFNRLTAFPEYSPVRLRTIGDWRIQTGDIISVTDTNNTTYTFPVFYHAIRWNGSAISDIEATGNEQRSPMSAHNRELIRDGARFHEFKVDIKGFESLLNNAKLRFDENGLTVFNAGMRVKNGMDDNADTMFEVDTDGNIILGGSMKITPDRITINDESIVSPPPGMEPEAIEITRDSIKIAQMKFWSQTQECGIISPLMMSFVHQYGDEGAFFFSTEGGEGGANSQTRIIVQQPATAARGKAPLWFDASSTWGDGWYTLAMSSSSRRYKEAIRYMENAEALSICEKLKPATYHHKSEPTDNRDMGFIAEEVDEVEKMLVFYDKDGKPDDVDYLHMVVLCIGAIKELSAKMKALESKIEELEQKGGV